MKTSRRMFHQCAAPGADELFRPIPGNAAGKLERHSLTKRFQELVEPAVQIAPIGGQLCVSLHIFRPKDQFQALPAEVRGHVGTERHGKTIFGVTNLAT
ncbi:hypothetical protein CSA57_07620 [candidate division KSB3 bacterium]|nr:MAG: hypothetical protein CSA57_07620 [candidate division KSB3 bacterium]